MLTYQWHHSLNEITGCSTELLFAGLPVPGRLEALKGVFGSKGFMISSKNAGSVTAEN